VQKQAICVTLKQNAFKLMLIFMKILKMDLKLKYCKVNKDNSLHIALATQRGQIKQK
jgi:hypothetical protein